MKQSLGKPTQMQLYVAYVSGADLNEYLRALTVVKNHVVALAIVKSDMDLDDVTTAIDDGFTNVAEIESAQLARVDLSSYIVMRAGYGRFVPSHAEAIEAFSNGLGNSYRAMRNLDISHADALEYSRELTPLPVNLEVSKRIIQYCLARSHGIAVDGAVALTCEPVIPADILRELLEADVSIEEILDVSVLDGNRSSLINRLNYSIVRAQAADLGYDVTHEQSLEVVRTVRNPRNYGNIRALGLSHSNALARL